MKPSNMIMSCVLNFLFYNYSYCYEWLINIYFDNNISDESMNNRYTFYIQTYDSKPIPSSTM